MKKKSIEDTINRNGYFFVLPFIIVYAAFQIWPVIYTFVLSFTNLQGFKTFKDADFIGFENFAKLIKDKNFWGSVGNTFIMWGWNFIPQLGIALLFAIWFTDVRLNLKGKGLFRAVFYMPNLLAATSVAILYRSLFAFPVGPVNQFLTRYLNVWDNVVLDGQVVQQGFNFFRSPAMSRAIVSFIQWWLWCGHSLIMLMAGITSISPTLYESAVVDGATNTQQTWYITLPLLRPMMLYILVTSMIGGMQIFEIPFLITGMHGEPDFKIRSMSVYLYNIGFQGRSNYAYAAAIAIGMFIITICFAVVINAFMKEREPKKKVEAQ